MHHVRLNRTEGKVKSFGDSAYSKEELTAEFGASFLSCIAGIENETIENSAAYIKGWLSVLKNNKKWLVSAAGKATKAANYILGISEEKIEKIPA